MRIDEELAAAFMAEQPQESARLLERVPAADAAQLLAELTPESSAAVFRELAPAAAAALTTELNDDALAAITQALPLDIAAATLRRLDRHRCEQLLARFEADDRAHLRALLAYPDGTAGALADPLALALPADITVREAQRQMRGPQRHLFYHVFVIARDRTLLGTLAMQELMSARPRQKLGEVIQGEVVRVDAFMDLATVAAHPAWRDYDALPVVDAEGKLVGAIRHRMIRQLAQTPTRPMMDAIVGLSELYWAGLTGVLASLTLTRTQEDENVTQ